MKHEKNQGTKSVPKANGKSNPTVERLTAEQLRQLTPQERIEYAKKQNGSQPKTTANGLVLDKSTLDKIESEKANTDTIRQVKTEGLLIEYMKEVQPKTREEIHIEKKRAKLNKKLHKIKEGKATKEETAEKDSIILQLEELSRREKKIQETKERSDSIYTELLEVNKLIERLSANKKKNHSNELEKAKQQRVEILEKLNNFEDNAFVDSIFQTFRNTIANFENTIIKNKGVLPQGDKTLFELGTFVAFSVMKTIISSTADPLIYKARAELIQYLRALKNLEDSDRDSYIYFDKNGKLKFYTGKAHFESVIDLSKQPTYLAMDLLNQACKAILIEVEYLKNSEEPLTFGFMEKAYKTRVTKGKTNILSKHHKVEWETIEIKPISNAYKLVREYIKNNKSVKSQSNKFIYVKDTVTDIESGKVAEIYYRLPKYVDIGSYAQDSNGKLTEYSVSIEQLKETVNTVKKFAKKVKTVLGEELSDLEYDIIYYSYKGYNIKGVSEITGVSLSSIKRHRGKLQDKTVRIGMGKESQRRLKENASQSRKVIAIDFSGTIKHFDSVSQASKSLSIDRANIIKVLNGERTKAKGYTFKYN